ncbi:hypothetical protein BB561_003595 [Smittium simulii]|uniref:Thiamine pyrophosphokinase n=1 Tax=Smittium simulii TaxID=133385 RepID=A0A2T9YKG6_9FUNG|nr:hypothetical protein BB561_003595 [Smittium simulii]
MPTDTKIHYGSNILHFQDSNNTDYEFTKKPIALIILNQPLNESRRILDKLWDLAEVKVCVDGGANRLYDFGVAFNCLDRLIPDVVVGDLDSLLEKTSDYYKSKNVSIIKVGDQYTTDFQKSISFLDYYDPNNQSSVFGDIPIKPKDYYNIIALGGTTGRLDHILHTLKVLQNTCKERNVLSISNENLTFAIPKGVNTIHVQKEIDGPTCGILPISGECEISTTGLKWDLDNQLSSLTGLLSSSNVIMGDVVSITTTKDIIWTSEFNFK